MTSVITKNGRLIAIVGPSGAGKDTLMEYAAQCLAQRPDIVFVQRAITRAQEAGFEAHHAVSGDQFAAMKSQHAFVVDWEAHGLCYGIPASMQEDLAQGRTCVVNGSRRALPLFKARFPFVEYVLITASPNVLAERLSRRGRETRNEIVARLARQIEDRPEDYHLIVENNDALEEAGRRLADYLAGVSIDTGSVPTTVKSPL